MKIWPYDSFEIETSMTLDEVVNKLEAKTEPKSWFPSFFGDHRPFQGEVSREGFKIIGSIRYHNSFLPVVRGSFKQGLSGITVTIKMRLHLLVIVFLCVFCAIMLNSMEFFRLFKAGVPIHPMDLIPVSFLVFPWAIAYLGFWFEANKQKQVLMDILK
jgi:hypothetical protein